MSSRETQIVHDNEELYRRILETTREGVWVLGPDLVTTFVNPRVAELLGYEQKQVVGRPLAEFMFAEDASAYSERIELRRQGQSEDYEMRLRRKNGQPLWVLVAATPLIDGEGRFTGTFGMLTDITERKRTEQALIRSEQQYRMLVEIMPDLVVRYDSALHRTFVNPAWEEVSGLSAGEVVNVPAGAIPRVPRPLNETYAEALRRVLATGQRESVEFDWINARGEKLNLQYIIVPERDPGGKVSGLLAVGRDVTDLVRAEEQLRRREIRVKRMNRVLGTLSDGNQALVRAADEQELLDQMCRVIVDSGGHTVAWIGLIEADGRTLSTKAWAGPGDLRGWPCGDGGTCDAPAAVVREGRARVSHDIIADAGYVVCGPRLHEQGCRSAVTLPVASEGTILGALSIYSSDPAAFDDEEVELLTELANDLGYGIGTLRARIDREKGQRRLQATMEATIQALASIVELRDPYTAGHQRRVAHLSTAIATELGLAQDRVLGLHLAAVCHDIGKIQVPAEILSKPGRLTAIEFELIKGHVDAGYEILRSIDFPWPLADVVRQHHERLDGSGYPLGVQGQALLIESRILAVADVVEAITTHRPYRAGLGVESALGEIRTGRGVLFDADVVDACVRLFTEKRFGFS